CEAQRFRDPGRPRPEPPFNALDRVTGRDMPQQNVDRWEILRIEKRVTPEQPLVANPEHAPADQTAPLSNGDDERSRIRTIEISPAQIASIPSNEKWI